MWENETDSSWHIYTEKNQEPSCFARKIIFWSLPEDREEWLPKIAEEFWKLEEYEFVFYFTEGRAGEMNLSELSGRVDFLVILITKRLLYYGKEELAVLFKKISETKLIPVFPIGVFDRADESEYERCFGEMHYVKYEETSYVKAPQTGKEYARGSAFLNELSGYVRILSLDRTILKQIREVFRTCAFVSYRKKDHAMLEEMMRQIHANPKFRRLALWHDDYLIPGENFSEEISEAIRQCRVFFLVVTPNLTEIPNYVADVEYPAAVVLKKAVLSIEMEPVDESVLQKMYSNLPACIKITEESFWEEKLTQLLAQDDQPDRQETDENENYLMGLACLNGILVAIDYQLAEEYLEQSAAAGNLSAMELLGTKYYQGILRTDSIQRLRTLFQYQMAAIEKLLEQKEGLSEAESSHLVRSRIMQLFKNAHFLIEKIVEAVDSRAAKDGSGSSCLSSLASAAGAYELLCGAIGKYRDYFAGADDFSEGLYTRYDVCAGFNKFYSKEEKKWKIGSAIYETRWRKTGSYRDFTLPRLLVKIFRESGGLFDRMSGLSGSDAASCQKAARSCREKATAMEQKIRKYIR